MTRHVDGVAILDETDEMRIAEIDGARCPQRSRREVEREGIGRGGERDARPVPARCRKPKRNLAGAGDAGVDQAAEGFEKDRVGAAFAQEHRRHAARRVEAGLRFATVHVVDAHPRHRLRGRRRLDDEKLVAAHAHMTVADPADEIARRRKRVRAAVDDDEIVAQAMHFQERPAWRWNSSQDGNRAITEPAYDPAASGTADWSLRIGKSSRPPLARYGARRQSIGAGPNFA